MAQRETKTESVQMCLLQFYVCSAIQAFIFYSLSTRTGFLTLILLVLWAQNTPNIEDWLRSKFKSLRHIKRELSKTCFVLGLFFFFWGGGRVCWRV